MGYTDPAKQREYQRIWMANKQQDPERHKRHLATRKAWRERNKERLRQKELERRSSPEYKEQKRKWAQAYRDRNREKLIDSNREYRQRLKKDGVIPASRKTEIDHQVYLKKRAEEKKYSDRHKQRQSKREKMLICPHNEGFRFEAATLGGVRRICNLCGKPFRQVGR